MRFIARRERLALVRLVVQTMPDGCVDKLVSVRYMKNYSDLDIRDELEITKKNLLESRERIKEMLIKAGVKK